MDAKFATTIESLHPSFERLLEMPPCSAGQLPRGMPASGVYLFSDGEQHLYVGRSRNMRRRYGLHTRPSAQHNQASFAFLLAREATGALTATYTQKGGRKELAQDPGFIEAFTEAKSRIRNMDYRFVEETDGTRQALLEIYCSVALGTPYNDFRTH
jgi:predicted GIY-YIG superfamily endonuclease